MIGDNPVTPVWVHCWPWNELKIHNALLINTAKVNWCALCRWEKIQTHSTHGKSHFQTQNGPLTTLLYNKWSALCEIGNYSFTWKVFVTKTIIAISLWIDNRTPLASSDLQQRRFVYVCTIVSLLLCRHERRWSRTCFMSPWRLFLLLW